MRNCVIGAGVTGLAAGFAGNCPVFEACDAPGGMSRSYTVRPGKPRRWDKGPRDPDAYRFDHGGGHWIFGLDAALQTDLSRYCRLRPHHRVSSVFFSESDRYVPFPIQNHLHCLEPAVARRALEEILHPPQIPVSTQAEWLAANFGPTLNELFFAPFHERYTAGLWTRLAPQDAYKSPVEFFAVRAGAQGQPHASGYNVTFHYPVDGLSRLWEAFGQRVDVRYNNRVVRIDVPDRTVRFHDGSSISFDDLLSTLPLHHTLELAGLAVNAPPDPFTSVLVLNLGGSKGPRCPSDHWLYVPDSRSGFHRVGIYSNVSPDFLPGVDLSVTEKVSFYIERAYLPDSRPDAVTIEAYIQSVFQELKEWNFLREAEAWDCHWVEVAYTWTWPRSIWKQEALALLERHGIHAIGRYGRWHFQGIADSLREGFLWGTALR